MNEDENPDNVKGKETNSDLYLVETKEDLQDETDIIEDVKDNILDPTTTQISLSLLFLAVFIDLLGFGIIIPILPFLVRETFNGSALDYGLIISLYSMFQFIFAPIWGSLSDRYGRKPIITIGLGGSIIGFSLFGVANSLWMLYAARIVAGIFTAATLTVANAYIADISTPDNRGANFGIIAAAFGLGFAVGPGIGGLMADLEFLGFVGWQLAAFFSALLAFLNMLGAIAKLPESLVPEDRKKKMNLEVPILNTAKYSEYGSTLWYIGIFSLVSLGFSAFIAAFPLFAEDVDPTTTSELTLGYYFTYAGLLLFFSQGLLIRPIIKRVGEAILVKIGIGLIFIGYLLVTTAPSFYWFFLTNTFFILGVSFVNPSTTSLISSSAPKQVQGEILGVNQGWASFMRIFGPLIAGVVYDTYFKEAIFYAGGIFFAMITILAILKVTESPATSGDS